MGVRRAFNADERAELLRRGRAGETWDDIGARFGVLGSRAILEWQRHVRPGDGAARTKALRERRLRPSGNERSVDVTEPAVPRPIGADIFTGMHFPDDQLAAIDKGSWHLPPRPPSLTASASSLIGAIRS